MLAGSRADRRQTLNIRIKAEERALIDRAAESRGQNRTEFVLQAARRAAEEALLDRAMISVGPAAYAKFVARLEAGPKPNARLRKTMQAPVPWAKG